jgi:transposase
MAPFFAATNRLVRTRHRSTEFIAFLKLADAHYPAGARIRIVLDNHSAHISRQTGSFLATLPNRFEFTFTPKHGSWLKLIESFFAKMAKSRLRGIRVASAHELKARIDLYLQEVNQAPVVFRWKYRLETLSVVQSIDMLSWNHSTSSWKLAARSFLLAFFRSRMILLRSFSGMASTVLVRLGSLSKMRA